MSDAAIITDAPAATVAHDLEEVLRLRAWARATLWQAGELELSEAVDVLQADAERDGLVELLGQDCVQEILAAAFADVRDPDELMADEPSGMETPELLSADADVRISEKHSPANDLPDSWDRMPGEALYSAIMRRRTEDCVTVSTFSAVRFALRNGGLAALNKQAERLRGFSDHQIESLIRNLHKNRNRFKAGGDPKLLRALTELLP